MKVMPTVTVQKVLRVRGLGSMLQYSAMRSLTHTGKFSCVQEENIASIFRADEYHAPRLALLVLCSLLLALLFEPEDGGSVLLRTFGKLLLIATASLSRVYTHCAMAVTLCRLVVRANISAEQPHLQTPRKWTIRCNHGEGQEENKKARKKEVSTTFPFLLLFSHHK
jgi:hypothetical protein